METTEIVKKHEKRFVRVRILVKILLVILITTIISLQWNNIIKLCNFF